MAKLPPIVTEKLSALSPSTAGLYARWLVKFYAHCLTPLSRVRRDDVYSFLASLANSSVSASYQNTALSALRWLVAATGQDVDLSGLFARRPQRLPLAATPAEATALLGHLRGEAKLVVSLVYGSGLTLSEAVNLRADQLLPKSGRIQVTSDRVTVLPRSLRDPLQLSAMLASGPRLFAVSALTVHRALKRAHRAAGLSRPIGTRELRFGFSARMLEQGETIVKVQRMMGYRSLDTLLKIQDQSKPRPDSTLG